MRKTVFAYVEIYYPRGRLHSMIGDRTPEQFEQRKAARSGVGFRWGGSSKLLAVNPL